MGFTRREKNLLAKHNNDAAAIKKTRNAAVRSRATKGDPGLVALCDEVLEKLSAGEQAPVKKKASPKKKSAAVASSAPVKKKARRKRNAGSR